MPSPSHSRFCHPHNIRMLTDPCVCETRCRGGYWFQFATLVHEFTHYV
jgi:hypothetical protein